MAEVRGQMAASNPDNAVTGHDERRKPSPAPNGGTGRILVIDDELLLGRTLRLAFQDQHDVVVVTSGREALERLAHDRDFDLILCDLMMPDMTGMAVYERIVHQYPEVADRLVFMTGGAFTDAARNFLELHPNAQLEKPFEIARVEQLLRAGLARRG
jgi:CheY-like chemotaxis protein